MKRICLNDIELQYKIQNYKELYDKVLFLIQREEIKPVKASGRNGKKPALYNEYWVLEEPEDNSQYMEELSYLFVPMISTHYYLNHIQQYRQDRQWLLLLNQYLKENLNDLKISKSMNERSFEIWHREKFLKEEQGKKILKRCGISLEALNLYETTEPLAYYVHTRQTPQNILIVENKDTFYSMRKHLLSGNSQILEKSIGTLVYGAGKGIFRSFQDFSLCAEPYMNEPGNVIYYFGDFDYEGVVIFEKVASLFGKECRIYPFTEGYLKMIDKAKGIGQDQLPSMKEAQNKNIGTYFWDFFAEDIVYEMKKILLNGGYIPQEILSIEDF